MADKELVRPIGLEPSWSNDQLLNDPGKSWDGTDTKVEPGAGKRDDGWLPDEQPAAQHLNHLLNQFGKWVQYLSNVQHQTWGPVTEVQEPTLSVKGANTLTRDMGGLGGGAWFSAGDGGGIVASPDGYDWTLINNSSGLLDWSASKDPRDAPILGGNFCSIFGGSTLNTVIEFINSVVTTRTLPGGGTVRANGGMWGNAYGLFNAYGHDGATNPVIWYSNPSAMGWASLPITKGTSTEVVDMAHDKASGLSVAVGNGGAPNADAWTSTDGQNWTLVPGVFPTAPRCISFNPETGLFVVLAGVLGDVWTSADGVIWNNIATAGLSAARRALSARGGLLLVPNATTRQMHASVDGGLTWAVQSVGFDNNLNTLHEIRDLAYAEDVGQYGIVMTGGYPVNTGAGQFRASLSCGTVLTKTDGAGNIILYTPTVT